MLNLEGLALGISDIDLESFSLGPVRVLFLQGLVDVLRNLLLFVESFQPDAVHGRLDVVLKAVSNPVFAGPQLLDVQSVDVVTPRADLLENDH